jgi:hypothetical protein
MLASVDRGCAESILLPQGFEVEAVIDKFETAEPAARCQREDLQTDDSVSAMASAPGILPHRGK